MQSTRARVCVCVCLCVYVCTSDCCNACEANPACTAFTFNTKDKQPTCWLKSSPGPSESKRPECTSGTNGRKPPPSPPPHSHTRCPNGWCLFELMQDPSELHEVSAGNPGVVTRLQAQMATVLLSYKQVQWCRLWSRGANWFKTVQAC